MQKPSEIKWSYRGIGPFSKNNKVGGIMAVFLTLKLFSEEFSDTSGKQRWKQTNKPCFDFNSKRATTNRFLRSFL